ncbi:MAG: hypothetical protein IJQ87_00405 [Clostridia bacterium]|nr:hypothetical protein [Clostridia bacterium]
MKFKGVKLSALLLAAVFLLFFSNDFGLIDIEKTAIITAVAIDLEENGEYKITAQIAVPEATDTNTENLRAQIAGKGSTVGAAIKNIGDTSGWFPQLCFCNLIIVGKGFSDYNIIKVLDYFSKTLRIQDSALIVMAETDGAELLKLSTPLDNISSFALQKILLKNAGLNRDVAVCDVKSFCTGYYSEAGSAYMPLIKVVSQKSENEKASADDANGSESSGGSGSAEISGGGSSGGSGSGGESGGAKGDAIFNADTTALFLHGKKVGELDANLTLAFNALTRDFATSTFEVKDVNTGGETLNYLLTVFSCTASRSLTVSDNGIRLNVSLDAYVKISDMNGQASDLEYIKNLPLPVNVKERAEADFTERITDLIRTEKETGCDFLDVKKELYRKHHSYYYVYKDNFIENMSYSVSVNFSGQK